MALVHFSKEGFEKAVNSGSVVVVDFWAEWCGPCKMLGPAIEKLAQEYEGKAIVGKVNIDQEQELAVQYGVMSIPTVVFLKDGRELERRVGLTPGGNPVEEYGQIVEQYQ